MHSIRDYTASVIATGGGVVLKQENVNNIEVTHLHWGLEIIFDEERRASGNEIWIDVYALTQFLAKHTQPVQKVEGTREWIRSSNIMDPEVEKGKLEIR